METLERGLAPVLALDCQGDWVALGTSSDHSVHLIHAPHHNHHGGSSACARRRSTVLYKPRGHSEWVSAVRFLGPHSDSTSHGPVVSGGMDGRVFVWSRQETGRGAVRYVSECLSDHRGPITLIKPVSGTGFLSASYDGTVRLWTPSTQGWLGTLVFADRYDDPSGRSTSRSPDHFEMRPTQVPIYNFGVQELNGSSHKLISSRRDGLVQGFDWATGALEFSLQAHSGPVHHLLLSSFASASHKRLITTAGTSDGFVRGFDPRLSPSQGRRVLNVDTGEGGISQLLEIGSLILGAGGGLGHIFLIDTKAKSKLITLDALDPSQRGPLGHPRNMVYALEWISGAESNFQILISWGDGQVSCHQIQNKTTIFLMWSHRHPAIKNACRQVKIQRDKNGTPQRVLLTGDDGALAQILLCISSKERDL